MTPIYYDNQIPQLEVRPEDIKFFEKKGKIHRDYEICDTCQHFRSELGKSFCAGCAIVVSDSDLFYEEDSPMKKKYVRFYNYEPKR